MAQCKMYDPDKTVFIDKAGCDRHSSMRKFGYALKGKQNYYIIVQQTCACIFHTTINACVCVRFL